MIADIVQLAFYFVLRFFWGVLQARFSVRHQRNLTQIAFSYHFTVCKKYQLKVILFICQTKYHILKMIIKNSVISFFEVRNISN